MTQSLAQRVSRLQVALEGTISKRAAMTSLAQGNLPQVNPARQTLHADAETWSTGMPWILGTYVL